MFFNEAKTLFCAQLYDMHRYSNKLRNDQVAKGKFQLNTKINNKEVEKEPARQNKFVVTVRTLPELLKSMKCLQFIERGKDSGKDTQVKS